MIKIWSKPGGSGGTACLKRLLKGLGCSRLKKCHCHQLSRWMARPKILRWGARQRRICHHFQWSPAIVDSASSERQEAKTLEILEKLVASLILFFLIVAAPSAPHIEWKIETEKDVENLDGWFQIPASEINPQLLSGLVFFMTHRVLKSEVSPLAQADADGCLS